jgi:hypothetical protein
MTQVSFVVLYHAKHATPRAKYSLTQQAIA